MSKIEKIVIHCSDSPDNLDIGVKEIRVWHTSPPRNWRDIGYHAVARRDGTIEQGRYENGDSVLEGKEIGAHVHGQNSDSLAICIVGRKDFTRKQINSVKRHIRQWMTLHGIPVEHVYGHYEFDKGKTCPNLDMVKFRESLALYPAK